jgi:hypothetical protein
MTYILKILMWILHYNDELKRESSGNTFMLNIESCGPGLQPTYGRYYVCFDGWAKATVGDLFRSPTVGDLTFLFFCLQNGCQPLDVLEFFLSP